jgi:hypothetical protein
MFSGFAPKTDSDVRINEFTPLVTAVLVALAAVITSGFGRPFDKPSPLGRCHPPLLVFNNSVRRSRPSCCRPVGAHVMSGELVKLALAGAAASVLIWVLSFLAPHCVPEHVGHLIQLAAC